MEQSPLIKSSRSFILDLPPSCIEFCPAHPQHCLIGTYDLVKETQDPGESQKDDNTTGRKDEEDARDTTATTKRASQKRNGTVVVFKLQDGELKQIQILPQPSALLDLHFSPHDQDIAAIASSTGTLAFVKLDPEQKNHPLVELSTSQIYDPSVLVLSCAWHPTRRDIIGVTTSTAEVSLLVLDSRFRTSPSTMTTVVVNELETWTLGMDVLGPGAEEEEHTGGGAEFLLYSGADGPFFRHARCALKEEADEVEIEALEGQESIIKGPKAGVTAILPLAITLPDGRRVVVVGSYDDTIRLYGINPEHCSDQLCPGGMGAGQILAQMDLGGGVWRLKLIDIEQGGEGGEKKWRARILASCMHAGVRVVEVSGDEETGVCGVFRVLYRFEEHKSMNYGSDFWAGPSEGDGGGKGLVCVSTSFYDKLVCLWEWGG